MSEKQWPILFYTVLLVCVIMPWPTYSYYEARYFNRITGQDITTVEAMFLQLRVVDSSIQEASQ